MSESLNKRSRGTNVGQVLEACLGTIEPRTKDVPAVAVRHRRGSIAGRDWA